MNSSTGCHLAHNPPPPLPKDDAETATAETENVPQAQPKKESFVKSRKFIILDCLFLVAGMVTYVADMGTDITVAVQYVFLKEYAWSALTIIFIVIPSLTIQYFSFRWFVDDSIQSTKSRHIPFWKKLTDLILWVIFHVLQLGVLKRYWRTVKYGWRSQQRPDYHDLSVYEYRDLTMLRLVESFMEAAPQLVLQVYIMTQQNDIYWLTATSAIISLASLSWGIEAYHKALRESCSNKNNLGYVGLAVRMMWRTFTITARVISLALFAAYSKWVFTTLVGIHYAAMTLWLIYQDTDFCPTRLEEVLFDGVIGIIHIFCFFNMKEGRTRYRALFFYTIILIENTVMFGLWYHHVGRETTYGLPALVLVWGGFFVGIFIMLFYYRCLHPNGNIRLWGKSKTPTTEDGNVQDEVDGPLSLKDIVVPSSTRGCHQGNLFTRKGRRHCYWKQEAPLAVKNNGIVARQPSANQHVDFGRSDDSSERQNENCCPVEQADDRRVPVVENRETSL